MDDELTPSDLFSPSKARQQRAQAQDWAQIESWLSYKYAGRTIPSFERNEETLKALRALCMANERADEEKAIKEGLERETLKELEENTRHPSDTALLSNITSHLSPTGQDSLSALASTSTILNTPDTVPETLGHSLIQHTITSQNLTNHITHIRTLQTYLTTQLTSLRTQLSEFQSNPSFTAPASLQRQTTEHIRQTKQLRSKIKEYEDKISFLTSTPGRGTQSKKDAEIGSVEAVAGMLEQQERLEEMRQKVETLEAEVRKFANLPADRDAARREVGKLELELDALRRRRDRLFEGLVG